jgi:hypothetical protein
LRTATFTGHFCTIVTGNSFPALSFSTATVSMMVYSPASATDTTVYSPSILKGTIILWSSQFSFTFPSQSAAFTVSPAFASGSKLHFLSSSSGFVYSPLFRNTPVILSRSFCNPSKFFDSNPGPRLTSNM